MALTLISPADARVPSKLVFGGTALWEEIVSPQTSPTYQINRDGVSCTRYFRIKLDQLDDFADELFPNTDAPGLHPLVPSLYVDTADISPFNNDGGDFYSDSDGIMLPEYFLASVSYSKFMQEITEGTNADLLDGSVNISNEVLMLPGTGFKWDGTADKCPETTHLPKIVPIIDREINLPYVYAIPWTQIRACVGCVNDDTLFGAIAETLLYQGCCVKFKMSFNGTVRYGLSHKFKERRVKIGGGSIGGWNHFYRKSSETFEKTDPLAYDPVDFTGLIPGVI